MPQTAKSALSHIIEGNPNNKTKKELFKRKKNEEKLTLTRDNLNPPLWLSKTGIKEFNRIVELMDKTQLLTDGDTNTLALYCDTLADYQSYSRKIRQMGMLVNDKANPFIREKRNAAQLLDKLSNELGLTPGSRNSLAIGMQDDENDDDDEFS